jgi:phosphatidate cytidylyltransferase
MRELGVRTASGLVFGVVVLGAYYLGGVPWFIVLALAAAIVSVEFYSLARHAGYRPVASVGVVMVLALVTQTFLDLDLAWLIVGLGIVTTVIWGYSLQTSSGSFVADWASTFAGVLYAGGMLLHGILLRDLPDGLALGALAILGTWSCDIFAYLIGRAWGRHKFAPRVSPKKTWEGAIGGFVCSFGVVMLAAWILGFSLVPIIGLGILIPLATIAGDLTESMLKRSAGVKDTGNWIPGHGGLLDRLDSLIFVIPTVYYYALYVVQACT